MFVPVELDDPVIAAEAPEVPLLSELISPAAVASPAKPEYVCRYDLTSVGKELNQVGEDPAAKADSKELAKDGLLTIWLMKPEGAAVSRTERTGAVGRALAS